MALHTFTYLTPNVSWPKQLIFNSTFESVAFGIELPNDHDMNLLLKANYTSHDTAAELHQSPRQLCSLQLARKMFASGASSFLYSQLLQKCHSRKKIFLKSTREKNPEEEQRAEFLHE